MHILSTILNFDNFACSCAGSKLLGLGLSSPNSKYKECQRLYKGSLTCFSYQLHFFADIDDDFEITVDSELDLDVTLGLDNGLASTGTSDSNP